MHLQQRRSPPACVLQDPDVDESALFVRIVDFQGLTMLHTAVIFHDLEAVQCLRHFCGHFFRVYQPVPRAGLALGGSDALTSASLVCNAVWSSWSCRSSRSAVLVEPRL